ncbi:MAG: polysaccharide pyruvyl transferase family protein, partial [Enterococcus sp.]
LVGGGNFGNRYPFLEYSRQFLIEQLSDFPCISFPQTLEFSEDSVGLKAFANAVRIYEKNQVILVARDRQSAQRFSDNFATQSLLVPDIVLSQKRVNPEHEKNREGVLFCLREDEERGEGLSTLAQEQIQANFQKASWRDTTSTDKLMRLEEREALLFTLWEEFSKAELVVTDRLHGMIFAAIHGTPCLVLDTCNHKVKYVYEQWLKENERILFLEHTSHLDELQLACEQVMSRPLQLCAYEEDFAPLRHLLEELTVHGVIEDG